MVNFDYQTPTRLLFGKGVVEKKLQKVMAQFGRWGREDVILILGYPIFVWDKDLF